MGGDSPKTRRDGISRVFLLLGITRSKSVEAQGAIKQSADDPDLIKEMARGRERSETPHPGERSPFQT
jgi:hypothetical protein